jgi:hypothetical protein
MSEAYYEVLGREPLMVDNRLTKANIKQALDEIERLSFLRMPNADWTVSPIKVTNSEWYRQKIEGEVFRTIFEIDFHRKQLVIIAILMRDNDTYEVTVRRLYEQSKQK